MTGPLLKRQGSLGVVLPNACTYRDSHISKAPLGFPELCCLRNGQLLVSTYLGYCLLVDFDERKVIAQPSLDSFLVPATLKTPTASQGNPALCCAATGRTGTGCWRIGSSEVKAIETASAVNCVAMSPSGELLAVGQGFYPLDQRDRPQAVIDLYATSDFSVELAQTVLPGVVVDRLVFHPSRDVLAVVTGERSQDRGWIFLLDSRSLDMVAMAETSDAMCHSLFFTPEGDGLVTASPSGLQVRSVQRLNDVAWSWNADRDLFAAAIDPRKGTVYLSNGQVIALGQGEVGRLPALEDCTGMAVLPDDRVAGVSQHGTLRVWVPGSSRTR